MATASYKELTLNGLWKNNPALVQLLGLCPLLAMTGSEFAQAAVIIHLNGLNAQTMVNVRKTLHPQLPVDQWTVTFS